MGTKHTTYVIASCENNKLTSFQVANRIAKKFNETRFDRFHEIVIQTSGFRHEFNGRPLLTRWTGKTFTLLYDDGYWGKGTHKEIEYATVDYKDSKICLVNYLGPAGAGWSGDAKTKLIEIFTEVTEV